MELNVSRHKHVARQNLVTKFFRHLLLVFGITYQRRLCERSSLSVPCWQTKSVRESEHIY